MQVIKQIEDYIINNEIEKSYQCIIENENEYIKNAEYWNLRGMLCSKIQEYNSAINCYKKSIELKNDYLDGYFNLVYTYRLIGENLKSILYIGIALRYTNDIEYINDIKNIYQSHKLAQQYDKIIEEIKNNTEIDNKDIDLVRYISSQFKNIDKEYITLLLEKINTEDWAYIKEELVFTSKDILEFEDFITDYDHNKTDVIIPYDINYINKTREIAKKEIKKCFIIVPTNDGKFELVEIDEIAMKRLFKEEYKKTVTLNKFNAADSNVYALIKYMPEKFKNKYKLNIINGRDVFNIENIVKVPLISSVTISGFNTFTNYPKFTYNIDVGHASIIMKNCGIMDKKNKKFAFTPEEYENIDKVCITSKMNMLIQSAFSAIPENKYIVTGNPRTDTLLLSNGKENIEKIIGKSIEGKKIIFNMPTFHIHENSGVVNGSVFNDSIKIKDFDYKQFDEFLKDNNIICISKVHHAEERTITNKVQNRKLENLLFVSNKDFENKNLDLYEVLNCADGLITDYSSIYGDFLFMNKPIIFVNADIEEYRKERGISLEPYDFWTAGPKVQTQDALQKEILKSLFDEEYYKHKREELQGVFYENKDSSASLRVWEHIDEVLSN